MRRFFCRATSTQQNSVMEHAVSRPVGDDSFMNIVAACRSCNNRKNDTEACDFVRSLYRDGLLSDVECTQRLAALVAPAEGSLPPPWPPNR